MQCGFKTPWHPSHTTGSYGNTGISGIVFPGVTSAPVGRTIRVASIREHGQALKDIRTPSRFSYAAKSILIPFTPPPPPSTSSNRRCFMYASSHLASLSLSRAPIFPSKGLCDEFQARGGIRSIRFEFSFEKSNSSKFTFSPELRVVQNDDHPKLLLVELRKCLSLSLSESV
jgi:hypothetical protein